MKNLETYAKDIAIFVKRQDYSFVNELITANAGMVSFITCNSFLFEIDLLKKIKFDLNKKFRNLDFKVYFSLGEQKIEIYYDRKIKL